MIVKNRLQKQKHSLGQFFIFTVALAVAMGIGLNIFGPAVAASNLTLTPITWNVMGLDSNDVTVGPNNFPVGVRVCNPNATAATNVLLTFVWDTTDTYINLRSGSYGTAGNPYPTIPSLAAGACVDVYYEVQITRSPSAYNHTARYHITAAADGLSTSSTPTPREIFVERLVSQSRNYNYDVKLNGVSVPAGGAMNLFVGQTYTIELDSKTATQGYEQIESFINFPNTIFEILSVTSTYNAPAGGTSTKLYYDACNWESDPTNLNYRSCLGVGKAGGDIANTYTIKILSGGGTSQTLSNLIYDFSGSSYHYNSDYATTYRIANIIDPASVTITKKFSPNPTNAGGSSTLAITLHNSNTAAISGANFTDNLPTLPGGMVIANPPNATTSGCGTTPTFAPVAGATSLSFSNGAIAANGDCVIRVNVTVPLVGTYSNTTNHLFIGTVDTGNTASANLTVNNSPAPLPSTCGWLLATWTFPSTSLSYTFKSGRVSTANISYSGSGASAISTGFGNPVNSWGATGGWAATNAGYPTVAAPAPYFEFSLDTSKFTNVTIAFQYKIVGNWADKKNNYLYVYSNADGGTFTSSMSYTNFDKNDPFASSGTIAALSTGGATTAFRINAVGQQQSDAALYLDNITVSGCAVPQPPSIAKSFTPDPIPVNGVSTLVFTLMNEKSMALPGVTFTDTLPGGLQVAATPAASTTCGGAPTWAPTAGATTLTFGSPNSATLPAQGFISNGSCTVQVDVVATTPGPHQNVSGFVSSTETGTNTGTTGFATASLTALLPPQISKRFSPTPILTGGVSTLTFMVTNPNPDYPLAGVAFNDTFPTSPGNMVVATPATFSTSGCGTPTFTPLAGAASISFSSGAILAGGACIVTVNVTATATGSYANTSGTVSATTAGSGNTASSTLLVQPVHPSISFRLSISTSSTGPWTPYVVVTPGTGIYHQLTVENTGDVGLISVNVTDPDPTIQSLINSCTWSKRLNLLPAPDAISEDHISVCVMGPETAGLGPHSTTATAHGKHAGTVYNSAPSTAKYDTAPADYDDLPDAYGTLQSVNGARHIAGSLFMGRTVTADTDGMPSGTASSNSDDGVTRQIQPWTNGATVDLLIDLSTSTFGGTADVGIWIDWNILDASPTLSFYPCTGLTTGGIRTCQVTIPGSATYKLGNSVFARVRLFDHNYLIGPGLDSADYVGVATNGEVKSYLWKFDPTAVDLVALRGHSAASPLPPLIMIFALAAGAIGLAWLIVRRKHI